LSITGCSLDASLALARRRWLFANACRFTARRRNFNVVNNFELGYRFHTVGGSVDIPQQRELWQ
jgi:hypothetical protein